MNSTLSVSVSSDSAPPFSANAAPAGGRMKRAKATTAKKKAHEMDKLIEQFFPLSAPSFYILLSTFKLKIKICSAMKSNICCTYRHTRIHPLAWPLFAGVNSFGAFCSCNYRTKAIWLRH
jgi:hypothetical protein